MKAEGHICSSCGHLSPAEWERCHNCLEELSEDSEKGIQSIANYYNCIDAGYGRYAVVAYSSTILSLVSVILITYNVAPGAIGSFLRTGWVVWSVGSLTVLFGCLGAIYREPEGNTSAPTLFGVVRVGIALLIRFIVPILILAVIPIINNITVSLIFLFVIASPYYVYKYKSNWDVSRSIAISTLLRVSSLPDGSELEERHTREQKGIVLEVIATTPTHRVTDSEIDAVIEIISSDVSSLFSFLEDSTLTDAVETVYEEAGQSSKKDIRTRLLKLGRSLESEGRSEAARTCIDIAGRLVDQSDQANQNTDTKTKSDSSTDSMEGDHSSEVVGDESREEEIQTVPQSGEVLEVSNSNEPPENFESWEDAVSAAGERARRLLLVRWETDVSSIDSEEPSSDSNDTKREKLIAELQRLDDGTNLFPYGNKVGTRGDYTFTEYTDEFSSWEEALDAAGIDVEARLLDELRRVRDEIGEMPIQSDMNEHGRVSAPTYARYLGSWSEAKSRIDPLSVEPSPDPDPNTRDTDTTGDDSPVELDSSPVSGERDRDTTSEESPGNREDDLVSSDPETATRGNSVDDAPDQDDRTDGEGTEEDEDEPQTGDDDLDALFDELDDMT